MGGRLHLLSFLFLPNVALDSSHEHHRLFPIIIPASGTGAVFLLCLPLVLLLVVLFRPLTLPSPFFSHIYSSLRISSAILLFGQSFAVVAGRETDRDPPSIYTRSLSIHHNHLHPPRQPSVKAYLKSSSASALPAKRILSCRFNFSPYFAVFCRFPSLQARFLSFASHKIASFSASTQGKNFHRFPVVSLLYRILSTYFASPTDLLFAFNTNILRFLSQPRISYTKIIRNG
jgi:hypothetical protein